jgi:hypothetical protein
MKKCQLKLTATETDDGEAQSEKDITTLKYYSQN